LGALTVHVGLLPLRARLYALRSFMGALQSRAFALCARSLAFVRAMLSFVRRPLAFVGNLVALIGDPVPSAGQKFALLSSDSRWARVLSRSSSASTRCSSSSDGLGAVPAQMGVHIPLFQRPQSASVGFHISWAPGAHAG